VRGGYPFDRLQLQDHFAVYDGIGSEALRKAQIRGADRDRDLASDDQFSIREFPGEDDPVDGLQQAGDEFPVNFDGGVEDSSADFVFIPDEIPQTRKGAAFRFVVHRVRSASPRRRGTIRRRLD